MKKILIHRTYPWPPLLHHTPGNTGQWQEFQFTEDAESEYDYAVILNHLEEGRQINCPLENTWRVVQEPPAEHFKSWHQNPGYSSLTFTCDPERKGPGYVSSQPMLPWHVNRDYDFLSSAQIPEKTKKLSWITSTRTKLEGHRLRMAFLEFIHGKLPDLDLLSTVVAHYAAPTSHQGFRKQIESKQDQLGFKRVEDKWAGLAPYTYSLAVENHSGLYYWSEKLADCFLSWTVPFYYGCTNIDDYFPAQAMIKIDITKPEEALHIIKETLANDDPAKRLDALTEARRRVLDQYHLFPSITRHIREKENARPHTTPATKPQSNQKRLTVIVCTFNRAHRLPACLDALVNQTVGQSLFDVLIVDNNSTDNTAEIAGDYVSRFSNFKTIMQSQQGLSHARNLGFRSVSTPYIAYLDDDALPPADWLETAFQIIDEHEPDIFGGPAVQEDHIDQLPPWYKQGYRTASLGNQSGWISDGLIPGCNFFIKKSLIRQYGGFDPALGMTGQEFRFHEETAVLERAFKEKKKVYYHNNLKVAHAVHDYCKSLAYFMFIKYQLVKEKYHLFKKEPFHAHELPALLDAVDDFFKDMENALRKRDKKKYPYPENYIIVHTLNQYMPYIVERLEYFRSLGPEGLKAKITGKNETGVDIDYTANQAVKNKQAGRLIFNIIKKKLKSLFK